MDKNEFIRKYKMREIKEEDGFFLDIKYATKENFTKEVLYSNSICLLRENTANKLIMANKKFNEYGYKIKIWDSFRTLKAQEKMWDLVQDERFVANPKNGKSNHLKGSAVDITLCDLIGNELVMPTEFDHFGLESYRNYYSKLNDKIKINVSLLENVMSDYGFEPFEFEWWHFNDKDEYKIINEYFI